MIKPDQEWLKVVELAREIRERKIPGLPKSTASLRDFIHFHRVNDNPELAKPTVFRNAAKGFLYHISFIERFARPPSDDWVSISELLKVELPGMPTSRTGYNKLVRDRGWRTDPDKYREARGAGSSFEYHISLLPLPARHAWQEYASNGRILSGPHLSAHSHEPHHAVKSPSRPAAKFQDQADLSAVKNSVLLAELIMRIFRALGDDDGRAT